MEFAVLLPLLVVILFATIAFGIGLSRLVTYVGAAREGARYAAVHCRPDALQCTQGLIQDRVELAAAGNPVAEAVSVSADCSVTPGTPVTISWAQPIPFVIPLVGDLSVTVDVSGTFRCE
ncbi:MAG TPA: TadE/TadG family type IV pilus assembly protein [Actinomycetota bacterium]|nr:TadE/TadG family type IV pilus assembly protein [Actinomycetota bacterium]